MEPVNAVLDDLLAASFDRSSTGATEACRAGDQVFVTVTGGVVCTRPAAALLLQLARLTSPATIDDCSRVVRKFVAEMERECMAVSDLVASGKTFTNSTLLAALKNAREHADKVASCLSSSAPFGSGSG